MTTEGVWMPHEDDEVRITDVSHPAHGRTGYIRISDAALFVYDNGSWIGVVEGQFALNIDPDRIPKRWLPEFEAIMLPLLVEWERQRREFVAWMDAMRRLIAPPAAMLDRCPPWLLERTEVQRIA